MFKRIARSRFDEFPDLLVAAVSATSAPRVEESGGLHLKIFYVSGGQLDELKKKLEGDSFADDVSLRHSVAMELMFEFKKCSGLFIVSTSVELLMVSDRSEFQYRVVEERYGAIVPLYIDLGKECAATIRRFNALNG